MPSVQRDQFAMATLDQDQAKVLEELREFKENFEVSLLREVYRMGNNGVSPL